MAQTRDVHDLLNGLLLTDRPTLRLLHQAVFPGGQSAQAPEQLVATLAQHVQGHTSVPPGLMRWIQAPTQTASHMLASLLRFASFYQDPNLSEPILVILRQLAHVAAHPAAVEALARIHGANASAMLTKLLWSTNVHQWHVREPAILRELGRLGDGGSIGDLVRALSVPYDTPMRAAAEALARYEPEQVLGSLQRALADTSNPHAMAGAAEALGRLGDARAVPGLQTAARASNARVAIHASVALARLEAPGAENRLMGLARSHDVAVRARSMGAMALIKVIREQRQHPAYGVLTGGLSDAQPEVRSAAAFALGRLRHSPSTSALCQLAQSEVSPLVRSDVVRALGELSQPASIPTLLHLLQRDSVSVQVEVLDALSMFNDPNIAQHIVPFRQSPQPRLVEAANRALRRLLHKPFAWPEPEELEGEVKVSVYTLDGARERLLPPPPPPKPPGFFQRLFGAKPTPPPEPPKPIGRLMLSRESLTLSFKEGITLPDGWSAGSIDWRKRFSVQITREPVAEGAGEGAANDDIGVHFTLRQRSGSVGANFATVAFSLWCAPSEAVGRFPVKSERLVCIDPHKAGVLLGALRWYAQVHGQRLGE